MNSDSFEVVPAEIRVTDRTTSLELSLRGPSTGFRMIDVRGRSRGDNPLPGGPDDEIVVTWYDAVGELRTDTFSEEDLELVVDGAGARTVLPIPTDITPLSAFITDGYGNEGVWGSLPPLDD